eukprot:201797_1
MMSRRKRDTTSDVPQAKKRNAHKNTVAIDKSSSEWGKYENMLNDRFSKEIGYTYQYRLGNVNMKKIMFLDERYCNSLEEYETNQIAKLAETAQNVCEMSLEYIFANPIYQYKSNHPQIEKTQQCTKVGKKDRDYQQFSVEQCPKWICKNKIKFNSAAFDSVTKYKTNKLGILNMIKVYQRLFNELHVCTIRKPIEDYCLDQFGVKVNNDTNWIKVVYEYVAHEMYYIFSTKSSHKYFFNVKPSCINQQKQWNLLTDTIKSISKILASKYDHINSNSTKTDFPCEWRYIWINKNVCEVNALLSKGYKIEGMCKQMFVITKKELLKNVCIYKFVD